MTDQRHHLTTEDFAERASTGSGPVDGRRIGSGATDRDGLDREPTVFDEPAHDKSLHGEAALTGEPLAHGEPARDGAVRDETMRDGTAHDETLRDDAMRDGTMRDGAAHGDTVRDEAWAQDGLAHDGTAGDEPVHDGTAYDETAQDDPAHDRSTARQEPVEPAAVDTTAGDAPLFTPDDAADYQAEWRALQADFVDDPREAVQRADELVAQVMQSLATTFTEHKHSLEEQWQRGDEAQTEELRQALKRYRTFFDRLLSV
ncbi:hypothetical protein ACWEFJ_32500 [Actinosynnema sp. NPDC004786]